MLVTAKRVLQTVAARQDLVLVAVLIITVGMLIMPLPSFIADVLIGCNLSVSVLMLMVAIYLRSPAELTTLPGIILVTTVFRLAIEVTVTRLILTEGDAGTIVATFGQFVIAGNVVVGLVVFMIITTVQFIVITKGTERVAEVGARFTLDSMPGKQMSIDTDLRAGDITSVEARRRRTELANENALHGAMDGALKFVKGDAIAGLIIIVVNMVGGVGIAVGQRGMAIGDAMQTYTLLTVGDALIAQIPALLISLTAAVLVTRVGGHGLDLGRDMMGQLTRDRQALRIAAFVLVGMALIPGFPKPVFFILAIMMIAASKPDWAALRRKVLRKEEPKTEEVLSGDVLPPIASSFGNQPDGRSALTVTLSPALAKAITMSRLEQLLALATSQIEQDLGFKCPKASVRESKTLDGFACSIDIEDVPIEIKQIPEGRLLLRDDHVHLELAGIAYDESAPFLGQSVSYWVERTEEARLRQAGIGFCDVDVAIAARVREVIRRHASRFIGLQETKLLVNRLESDYGDLLREALRIVPVQKMADILRRLVEEEVPLRNMRLILETLVEWGEREPKVLMLVEYVRQALSRQICYRHASPQKLLSAYVLTQDTEQLLRDALRDTPAGPMLALDPESAGQLVGAVRERLGDHEPGPGRPIIVASLDVRRFLRGLLARNGMDVAIFSYQDLASEFPVHPIGPIGLRLSPAVRSAETA